ncbi:MAG: hypothetical protein EOO06_00380 [Chitinophagaceae bacterium]|nr:MAG: hypothetical protein EOO06_00380 [Chitinophagaceae bacterium]
MANCVTISGFSLGCNAGMAGISKVYIGDWVEGDSFVKDGNGIIGTFSFAGATTSYYTFEQEIGVGSFVEPPKFENNNVYYEQSLQITLHNLDNNTRKEILALNRGKWRVIIQDQRGNYKLMGENNPVRASAGDIGVGKAPGDLHGAIITFTCTENEMAPFITAACVASVV